MIMGSRSIRCYFFSKHFFLYWNAIETIEKKCPKLFELHIVANTHEWAWLHEASENAKDSAGNVKITNAIIISSEFSPFTQIKMVWIFNERHIDSRSSIESWSSEKKSASQEIATRQHFSNDFALFFLTYRWTHTNVHFFTVLFLMSFIFFAKKRNVQEVKNGIKRNYESPQFCDQIIRRNVEQRQLFLENSKHFSRVFVQLLFFVRNCFLRQLSSKESLKKSTKKV